MKEGQGQRGAGWKKRRPKEGGRGRRSGRLEMVSKFGASVGREERSEGKTRGRETRGPLRRKQGPEKVRGYEGLYMGRNLARGEEK